MSETWELFALKPPPPPPQTKTKSLYVKSTVQVESEQATLHTKHNLEKKTPVPTHKKTREAPSLHDLTSHWLHGNFIPKIGCHYFGPGLIA